MICCHYKPVAKPYVRFIILLLWCLLLFLSLRQYISNTPTRIRFILPKSYSTQTKSMSENIDARLRVFPFCKDVKNRKQENPITRMARPYLKDGGIVLTTEPSKRLAFCPVQKSGSTTWMTAFAEMNAIDGNQLRSKSLIIKDYRMMESQKYAIYAKTNEDIDKLNSRSLFKFMFVRHPFYRLASTFQFMFVRDGIPPKKNVELIRNYQKKHMKLDDKDLVFFPNVSFAIFTEFLLHQAQNKNRSFDSVSNLPPEAIHWWPYSEQCGVCRVKYDLIGHMETFNDDVQLLFQKFPDIPVLKKMQEEAFISSVNWHAHKANTTDYINIFKTLNKSTIVRLYTRFKTDFEFGGYPYPSEFIDIGLD